MAREESNREDLLREATALVERIELVPKDDSPIATRTLGIGPIVAGFRRNGALSIFFGEDPVYQFNATGELRRAYCEGKLLKASRGHLTALTRRRTQNEVQLIRHQLSQEEETAFLSQMDVRLRQFSELLNANLLEVVGQVPPDVDVVDRLKKCLARHTERRIAVQPNL
jgi:hypothetical protein